MILPLFSCGRHDAAQDAQDPQPGDRAGGDPGAPGPAGPAQNSQPEFPLALPDDRVQPWERLDEAGLLVPTRESAGINAQSEFAPGVERFRDGGQITELGEALRIEAAPGQLAYAIYRLAIGSAQPGAISLDVNPGSTGIDTRHYFVGLANYSSQRWDWHGPFSDNHVRLSPGAAVSAGADFSSEVGSLFVALLAFDGASLDVVGVGANMYEPADATAPPVPTGLTLSPAVGGLELQWNDVIAGDLAGYRIYLSSGEIPDAPGVEVERIPYLQGGRRFLLPADGPLNVRISAVDVSGNESPLSTQVSSSPAPGSASGIAVSTDVASGVYSIAATLSVAAAEGLLFDYDLDGDGVFEISSSSSAEQQIDTQQAGILRPAVRAQDGTGVAVAHGAVSLLISSNSRPVALASADPQSGPAPLQVNFSGTAEDDDGTISDISWDFDGDGFFGDSGEDSLSPAAQDYPDPGLYNAKLRVEDDQGSWDVDTASVLAEGPPPPPLPNLPPVARLDLAERYYWIAPDEIEFMTMDASSSYDPEGQALAFYYDTVGNQELGFNGSAMSYMFRYVVPGQYFPRVMVEDEGGLVDFASVAVTAYVTNEHEVRDIGEDIGDSYSALNYMGRPVFAFYNTTQQRIEFAVGSGPADHDPQLAAVINDAGPVFDMAIAGSSNFGDQAGIVFKDESDDAVYFSRNTDAGLNSYSSVLVEDNANNLGDYCSLGQTVGNPVVCYYDATGGNLKFARSNGSAGSGPYTVVPVDENVDDVGRFCQLEVVLGRPAIAYYNATDGSLLYIRADNSSGTTWPAVPVLVDDTDDSGVGISMAIVDGRPAIAYVRDIGAAKQIYFVHALDASGDTWEAPVEAVNGNFADDPAVNVDLVEIGGRPYIASGLDNFYITRGGLDGSISEFDAVEVADGGRGISIIDCNGRIYAAFGDGADLHVLVSGDS
jgi:PKD repeat protein